MLTVANKHLTQTKADSDGNVCQVIILSNVQIKHFVLFIEKQPAQWQRFKMYCRCKKRQLKLNKSEGFDKKDMMHK